MSIFDEEKPVNIPLPVVDGQVFWDVLAERNGCYAALWNAQAQYYG